MKINFLMSPEDTIAGGATTPPVTPPSTTPPVDSGAAATPPETIAGGAVKAEGTDKAPPVDAPKTEANPKDTAPVEIEVKFPDGVKADETFLTEFKSVAKDLKLDSAGAQKLVDLQMKAQKQANDAAAAQWTATQKQWVDSVKADKEIGGAKLAETQEICRQAVARFGGKELSDFLNQTGFGSHPAVVKAFHKIGMSIREDNSAGRVGNGSPTENNKMKQRYPNTPNLHK